MKIKVILSASLVTLLCILCAPQVNANGLSFDPSNKDSNIAPINESVELGDADPIQVATLWINGALTLLGTAFLVLLMYAGFVWMFARGNEEEVKKAQNIIKRSVIGLTIILMSYGISYLIFAMISNAADSSPATPPASEPTSSTDTINL